MAYLLLREYRWPIGIAILLHISLLLLFCFSLDKDPAFKTTDHTAQIIQAVAINALLPKVQPEPTRQSEPIVDPELDSMSIPKPEPIKAQPPKPRIQPVIFKKPDVQIKWTEVKVKETANPKPVKEVKADPVTKSVERKPVMDENKQKAALLAKQQQAQADKLFQEQLQAEQKELDMAAQVVAMQGEVDKYKGLILQAIAQHWLVPQLVNKNLFCKLLIRLAPGGMVLTARLIQTSGDPALDRSALAAVYKASPLPVPDDPQVFDKFRELSLTVYPQAVSG